MKQSILKMRSSFYEVDGQICSLFKCYIRLTTKKTSTSCDQLNGNVIILTKFSSLAALEVARMTTSSAASDENFVKMTLTFRFQWAFCTSCFPTSRAYNADRFLMDPPPHDVVFWWYIHTSPCMLPLPCRPGQHRIAIHTAASVNHAYINRK